MTGLGYFTFQPLDTSTPLFKRPFNILEKVLVHICSQFISCKNTKGTQHWWQISTNTYFIPLEGEIKTSTFYFLYESLNNCLFLPNVPVQNMKKRTIYTSLLYHRCFDTDLPLKQKTRVGLTSGILVALSLKIGQMC